MRDIAPLLVVAVICLLPTFLMADRIDGDEFAKAGLALAGTGVAAVLKLTMSRRNGQ